MASVEYYIDGLADGVSKKWYANGRLDELHKYKKGEYVGIWKEWYENGKIYSITNYEKCEDQNGRLLCPQQYWDVDTGEPGFVELVPK